MRTRTRVGLFVAVATMAACSASVRVGSPTAGPAERTAWPERAVRRDIPMPPIIKRSFAAGVRDSTGRPGRNYWQLRTDYTINVRLDPTTSRLTGRETIAIRNSSPDNLSAIRLRLDMNHFLFNVPRAAPWVPSEETDGMVITRMAVNGQNVTLTTGGGRGGAAGGGNSVTGLRSTLATVNLASPIPAGGTASLEIDWNHKVPGAPPGGSGHRMTQRWGDTLYQPTQWFPRVAVYDDLRGWDPELYLGPSEFYNNFGRFDVSIDVPAGWIVSGTGILQNPQQVLTQTARDRLARAVQSDSVITIVGPDEVGPGRSTAAGDRLVWRMVADTVNDFAWATAKNFVWKATRANIPTKGMIPIHMVHLPGNANSFANAGPISRHALEFYSRLWFPYQWSKFTLQDGPSAGMEYPMVINSNQGAADHEAGHQWWPMVVGNNETWYGWMDEGFNQYMNIASDRSAAALGITGRGGRAGGAGASPTAPFNPANPTFFDGAGQSYGATAQRLGDSEAPMMWNANYAGPPSYSFTTYSKTPLMLSMLGGIVGDSAVQRAHAEWGKAWMFKHPSPWDYMFFMNKALNRDLGWFWYSWLFATETVDGSIQSVTTSGGKARIVVRQDGQMPSPVVLRLDFDAAGGSATPAPKTVTFPVEVWFDGRRTYTAEVDVGNLTVRTVTLDPSRRFPDRDVSDNVWPKPVPPTAPGGRGRGH
jgi:hypothetical protein